MASGIQNTPASTHRDGETAGELFQAAERMMTKPVAEWGGDYKFFTERATALKTICAQLGELEDRWLFYALSRRIWDLREELDLFLNYFAWRVKNPTSAEPYSSDFHLAGTYRGGFVGKLRRLLKQDEKGGFKPNA